MGWFVRVTRTGPHVVYSQQADSSCGIACVIMINFKVKKWQLGAAALNAIASPVAGAPATALAFKSAVKAEEEVYAAYAKVTGQPYDGSTYSDAFMLIKVLDQLGIGSWACEYYPTNLSDKILGLLKNALSAPVIVHVKWRGNGAHFVVCDNVVRQGQTASADFCDPWDGMVRNLSLTKGRPITYHAADLGPARDFGQSRHRIDRPNDGSGSGWLVYRRA